MGMFADRKRPGANAAVVATVIHRENNGKEPTRAASMWHGISEVVLLLLRLACSNQRRRLCREMRGPKP